MQQLSFQQRVLNVQFKLSDTEDELTTFILQHREQVSTMTINELAKQIFSVPNTITRCCKKLGYSGYAELKFNLKRELEEIGVHTALLHNAQPILLERTFALIDSEREAAVVTALERAHKVLFFAVGETAYVASNFAHMFNAVDQKSTFMTYENQIIYECRTESNLVLVLISLSGETPQLLKVAQAAQANNHYIISLTHLANNQLSHYANSALYCYSPRKEWHGYNLTDKTPLFLILNSLFYRYFQ